MLVVKFAVTHAQTEAYISRTAYRSQTVVSDSLQRD